MTEDQGDGAEIHPGSVGHGSMEQDMFTLHNAHFSLQDNIK